MALERKIKIFKSLASSKMLYLALLMLIPNSVLVELKKIQKTFLWGNKRAKIKDDTLCNNFNKGGLKSVGIKHNISALKCSWIQRLYNENFHEGKLIPLRYTHKGFSLLFTHSILPGLHFHKLLSGYNNFFVQVLLISTRIALNNFFTIFMVQYLSKS